MSSTKPIIFLGAYINSPNAQNLNCRSLAKYLDKTMFRITALSLYSLPKVDIEGVGISNCLWPHRITVYWAFFWNILKADIVYLPKGELLAYNTFLCQLLNKKCFTTIEGILDITNLQKAKKVSGSNVLSYYKRFTRCYSISKFIKTFNFGKHQLRSEPLILELGTDSHLFAIKKREFRSLANVVMIANNFEKKGINDYLKLASEFPLLRFHLIGGYSKKIKNTVEQRQLKNIIFSGRLDRNEYKAILSDVQLHILPSKSEGFPKVILETACCGIPSLVYSNYGADQWITHNENGFVVDTYDEMKSVVSNLLSNLELLKINSLNALKLGKSYDWKHKIKVWEEVLLDLIKEH